MKTLGVALCLLPLAAGMARSDAIDRGRALAEAWCARCHVVAPGLAGGDAGPPFPTMSVETPGDERAMAAWLAAPHDPMPDLDLAPRQIEDLILYIRSISEDGQ